MKKHRLAFIDTETTGLDPTRHEVFEIGIVFATQQNNSNGDSILVFESEVEFLLKPEHLENADPKSLEIGKFAKRDFTHAYTQADGLSKASELLKGCIFIAQNVSFDWSFLLINGKKYNVDFDQVVHYHKLDLASMVFGKLYHDSKLFKYSLRELTEYFNIKNLNAHTALSDARATFEVCKKLLELPKA